MVKIIQHTIKEEVLDNVMNLFWEKGYLGTSIDDIVKCTGLNKNAIYKNFDGKEGLYASMLDRYLFEIMPQLTEPLNSIDYNPILSIQNFIKQFSKKMSVPINKHGCFLVLAATEAHSKNSKINKVVETFFTKLNKIIFNLLSKLKNKIDCKKTTNFIIGNIFGLMTLFRSGVSKKIINDHIKGLVDYLDSLKKFS